MAEGERHSGAAPEWRPEEYIVESGRWYQQQYARLVRIIAMLAGTMLVFVATDLAWDIFVKPEPRYIAVTPDLRVVELEPLSSPVTVSMGLENWAADTITRALSLDYLNWKRQLKDIRPRFTDAGWTSFLKALKRARLVEILTKRRLIMHTSLDGAAAITATLKGPVLGWEIEVPVLVSLESTEGVVATYRWRATVTVRRVDQRTNPHGIAVHQVIISQSTRS